MLKRVLVLTIALAMLVAVSGCKKSSTQLSSGTEYLSVTEEIIVSDNDITESKVESDIQNSSNPQVSKPEKPDSNNSSSESDDTSVSVLSPTRKLPTYTAKQFGTAGFWAPYELNEKTLTEYKNAGLNTLIFCNHSLEKSSDNFFYLGSNRTMKALELCKKLGLKAIISYGDWLGNWAENDQNYMGDRPFSKHNVYEDYKDIIVGVSIVDEPKADSIEKYANKTLVEDFKKVYPNAAFQGNLIPMTAGADLWGYKNYENMLDIFEERFMKPFKNPYISLDLYPFHLQVPDSDLYMAANYRLIAERAKKYNAETTFILQTATGNEFEAELSEGDLRWEINSAIAFGADNLQYYCYAVPLQADRKGGYMYDYCILKPDNTPSNLYYYLQDIHKEIQSYAGVILSYNWDKALGVEGSKESAYRVSDIMFNTFDNSKHYVSATATHDLVVSRFTSKDYGEGYMFVNFADRGGTNKVEATFTNCGTVAVYGGKGYNGTPKFIDLDKNGKISLELQYGDGVFITPLV